MCLRSSEFSTFINYTRTLKEAMRRASRNSINFANMQFRNNHKEITHLDLEIRTFDNSLNVNHVALIRFLMRTLWMRAVEISGIGQYVLRSTNEWVERKKIIASLNRHERIHYVANGRLYREAIKAFKKWKAVEETMKNVAEELYLELEHLMTNYEKEIFKEFVDAPIWLNRSKVGMIVKKKLDKITEFDLGLICLLKTRTVFAATRKTYYKKVAKVMGSTVGYVRTRLSKINGKWNKETGCYVIK